MDKKPWDIEPELTEDRLCSLANIIKEVRNKAVSLHDPDKGDGAWSLGCRVYERTINTITDKAETLPWLDFYRDNLYFIIMIKGVPLRFFKGRVNSPTLRTLRQRFPEQRGEQIMFDFESDREWFWRMAIETEEDGSVFRILLGQYDKADRKSVV